MPSKRLVAAAAKQTARLVTTKAKPKIAGNTLAVNLKSNDLEKLHEKSNVISNLKLRQGHQLKLDSEEQRRRKHRPFRDFNIKFADLNDSRPQTDETEYHGNNLNDDELPEPQDILKSVSTATEVQTPSETNYSNSDFDSLIRAVPLDDSQEVSIAKIWKDKDTSKKSWQQPGPPVVSPSTPPPRLKRNREACLTSSLERRNKIAKIGASSPHVLVYSYDAANN